MTVSRVQWLVNHREKNMEKDKMRQVESVVSVQYDSSAHLAEQILDWLKIVHIRKKSEIYYFSGV